MQITCQLNPEGENPKRQGNYNFFKLSLAL